MSKTVLITGGCGFIGHHFVEHISVNTDWNIIVLDKLTYDGFYICSINFEDIILKFYFLRVSALELGET